MKRNEIKELHTKTVAELRKLSKEASENLVSLKIAKEQNALKQTSSLTAKRREIAVLKTIMNLKVKEAVKNG